MLQGWEAPLEQCWTAALAMFSRAAGSVRGTAIGLFAERTSLSASAKYVISYEWSALASSISPDILPAARMGWLVLLWCALPDAVRC